MSNVIHQYEITDTHGHLVICRPPNFPNRFLGYIADTKAGFFILKNVLHGAIPFTDNDVLDKLLQFAESNKITDWQEKFLMWRKEGQWSERTRLVVLTVNMSHMGAGIPKKTFGEICMEAERFRQRYPKNVLLFFHYDCRSGNAYDLFKNYVLNGEWAGVKMYNSMGTMPQDERHFRMYEDLQRIRKPIIAHCTYSNPIRFYGKKEQLKELLKEHYDEKASMSENCNKFLNPDNWGYVSSIFEDLYIDLAHMGGGNAWDQWWEDPYNEDNLLNKVLLNMKNHENIYGDFAFTLNNKKRFPIFKKLYYDEDRPWLKEKMLFGTDWDMTKSEVSLKQWSDDFRFDIGEEAFNQVARINPKTFLGR